MNIPFVHVSCAMFQVLTEGVAARKEGEGEEEGEGWEGNVYHSTMHCHTEYLFPHTANSCLIQTRRHSIAYPNSTQMLTTAFH